MDYHCVLFSFLFACRVTAPALATQESPTPEASLGVGRVPDPLVPFETTTLRSEALGEERRVTVYLPPAYDAEGPALPVLYLPATDGTYLHFATGTARILEAFGEVPAMIVVGLRDVNGQRDLTPTPDREGHPGSGGGGAFLAHIRDEAIPFVEASYNAGPRRFLWGHSIVGAFALYAFLSEPGQFEGVIVSSPWMIYDGSEEFLLRSAPAWLEGRDGKGGALFFSVGDEPRLAPACEAFAAVLEEHAPEGLRWELARLAGEDHRSTLPLTLPLGLRWMLE